MFATSSDGSLTLELLLQDNTGTALANNSLPGIPPSLAAFDTKTFSLFDNLDSGSLEVEGNLTALSVPSTTTATPEPSQAAVVLIAMAGLALASRARRLGSN